MSANFTPEKEDLKILTPFKMQVLTNFPYIEADFDALTNYQLLCKVVEYLNNVITESNEVTEQVLSLYNAYVSLQNYVNTYFDTLDLQEEVNIKIDEMVEDGTLTNIIKEYVDPIYEAYETEINGEISDFKDAVNSNISDQNDEISTFESSVNSQISIIDNKVQSATSGSPAGVYATVSALTTADPDHTKIYLVTADGHWYYYANSQWNDGGVYQATAIGSQEIENINIKSKNIKPNNIENFKNYDLSNSDGYYQYGVSYDGANRLLNKSGSSYYYSVGGAVNGRSIKTRIPRNSYLTINKEISDLFRAALFTSEPSNNSAPDKIICDDNTITNIGFNTESYNWLVVSYTTDNSGEVDIEVLLENVLDYNSLLREENVDIFDKVYSDNLFDKNLIVKNSWLGPSTEHYRFNQEDNYSAYRSYIFPLNYNEDYTIVKSLTGKFRVGLFLFYPERYVGTEANNYFKMYPNEIVIDDETAETCTFNSGNYRYCVITYTITGEDVNMTITNESNSKYVLKDGYIPDMIQKTDGGYIIKDNINPANALWSKWDGRLAFGMNTETAPVPVEIDSQLLINGTCIVRNLGATSNNRWTFHVYEAYGVNNYDRITMLMNKHDNELNKKVAELYYYTGASHAADSYAWYRLGSDVQKHSFMFDRDRFVAYGISDLKNVMTLARISPTNDLITTYSTVSAADSAYEPENYPDENNKCLLYIALLNAENGSMFYDTDRNKIVVKVNGAWCDMDVTPVPNGTYNF